MRPEYHSGSLYVQDTQQAGETTDEEPAIVVAERYRQRQIRLRLGGRTFPAHELIITHFGSEESLKWLQAELVRHWDPSANTSTLKNVIFAHIPDKEKLWVVPKTGPGSVRPLKDDISFKNGQESYATESASLATSVGVTVTFEACEASKVTLAPELPNSNQAPLSTPTGEITVG